MINSAKKILMECRFQQGDGPETRRLLTGQLQIIMPISFSPRSSGLNMCIKDLIIFWVAILIRIFHLLQPLAQSLRKLRMAITGPISRFIAGGIVPGVLLLKPDFLENKDDWPFLWGENECVIDTGAAWVLLSGAVNELLNKQK